MRIGQGQCAYVGRVKVFVEVSADHYKVAIHDNKRGAYVYEGEMMLLNGLEQAKDMALAYARAYLHQIGEPEIKPDAIEWQSYNPDSK